MWSVLLGLDLLTVPVAFLATVRLDWCAACRAIGAVPGDWVLSKVIFFLPRIDIYARQIAHATHPHSSTHFDKRRFVDRAEESLASSVVATPRSHELRVVLVGSLCSLSTRTATS